MIAGPFYRYRRISLAEMICFCDFCLLSGRVSCRIGHLAVHRYTGFGHVAYKFIALCIGDDWEIVTTNDAIRTQISRMYADFVSEVDPKGVVADYLLQENVLTPELKEKVTHSATRQQRCRELLDELLKCSNPRAFIVLRDALLKDGKTWIVDKIDGASVNDVSISIGTRC